ncbi:MAG: 16S rRNA (uracil(1498)-N(3))-methyltransferase [Bacteroidetes bacterium]|nr:16S rRNA (uracil(1498)-N(3))-methyltransferase [Bacteroidota bacterium]
MSNPLFYSPTLGLPGTMLELDQDNSRHAIQVLRLIQGSALSITDGKGNWADAVVAMVDRKKCSVTLQAVHQVARPKRSITLAISLLKNSNRFEWLLEKVTELGVTSIIPLRCQRTEKENVRMDRLKSILISALLQSQQAWLPELLAPQSFADLPQWKLAKGANLLAHCENTLRSSLSELSSSLPDQTLIAIGPEGDFTTQEISQALAANFIPVQLGNTRLRTETAGVVAVSLLAC